MNCTELIGFPVTFEKAFFQLLITSHLPVSCFQAYIRSFDILILGKLDFADALGVFNFSTWSLLIPYVYHFSWKLLEKFDPAVLRNEKGLCSLKLPGHKQFWGVKFWILKTPEHYFGLFDLLHRNRSLSSEKMSSSVWISGLYQILALNNCCVFRHLILSVGWLLEEYLMEFGLI